MSTRDDMPDRRELEVPPAGNGLRLDRFLALRFPDRSRSGFAQGIRLGQVTDADGRPLRASTTVHAGQVLHVYLPGIAPAVPPPPFPPILHEDDRVVVIDKPAGLLCHPGGTTFVWAVVGLARHRWPRVDLAHRLDRDTSGALVLSKDPAANGWLKAAFEAGKVDKEYEAIVKGTIGWDEMDVDAPIGPAGGEIRVQMGVRPRGQRARTHVTVLGRTPGPPALSRVRCRIATGRTHQIRVHLDHLGFPVLGDRLYGVPPSVFLGAWQDGVDEETVRAAGAPRQALHARSVRFPHPDGGEVHVVAPVPDDMERWWSDPGVLPLDSREAAPPAEPAPERED